MITFSSREIWKHYQRNLIFWRNDRCVCLLVTYHPIEARSEALRKPPNVLTLNQRFTQGQVGQKPNDDDNDGDDSY